MISNVRVIHYEDYSSALMIILDGTKEEHLDMLQGGIIEKLLEEKWKTFARVSKMITINAIVKFMVL